MHWQLRDHLAVANVDVPASPGITLRKQAMGSSQHTVLYVEDSPNNMQLMEMIIGRIAIAAHAMPNDVTAGLKAGLKHYIIKLVKVSEFIKIVEEMLECNAHPPLIKGHQGSHAPKKGSTAIPTSRDSQTGHFAVPTSS